MGSTSAGVPRPARGIFQESFGTSVALSDVGRIAVLLVLAALPAVASPIYAISSSDEGRTSQQDLYLVDAITGVLTRIGPVTAGSHPLDLESLAFTPSLGLYGLGHGALYQINTSNGQATDVGPVGAGLTAMVYGPDGVMYGTSGNRLYSIDISSGNTTLIGSGSYHSPESLEFDAAGVLYAVVDGHGEDSLYRIDTATGAGTRVGNPGAIGFGDVEGLAFVNGTMYGYTEDGLELSINLTSGVGSLVRHVGVGFEATAVDPPQTPEPASLLLAGVALAGLLGWRRWRISNKRRADSLRHLNLALRFRVPALPRLRQRSGRALQ